MLYLNLFLNLIQFLFNLTMVYKMHYLINFVNFLKMKHTYYNLSIYHILVKYKEWNNQYFILNSLNDMNN